MDIDQGGVSPVGVEWGEAHEEGTWGLGLLFPLLILSVLPPADAQKESKENQWLGVSVRSQGPGGKIVVSTTSCDCMAGWGVCMCVCTVCAHAQMCL